MPSRMRVSGIRFSQRDPGREAILRVLSRTLCIRIESLENPEIVRRSLDARRRRSHPTWTLVIDVDMESRPGRMPKSVDLRPAPAPHPLHVVTGDHLSGLRVCVVGTGPAGLFTALALRRAGAQVSVLERGAPIRERVQAVAALWRGEALNLSSNVQFGEGGAGLFSDGKLTTRVKDPRVRTVLGTLVEFGAPPEILIDAHPHLGTDGIRRVLRNLTGHLSAEGVELAYGSTLREIEQCQGGWTVRTDSDRLSFDRLFLAPGHSARSLVRTLHGMGIPFRKKGFAVGTRVEHPQSWVDSTQYGEEGRNGTLPPARYTLTYQHRQSGRGVFSFCMCPGGLVVNAASDPEMLVVNGMSLSHRASPHANAGIVVTVRPEDLDGDDLAGIRFQEDLERRAWKLGGGWNRAPAQTVGAFLEGRIDSELQRSSYRPSVTPADLNGIFPEWIRVPLHAGLKRFNEVMPGFIRQGLLIAPETRTSSPVQVERSDDGSVSGFPGLYILGEGAGWAGGIVSSAVDALKICDQLKGR